MSGLQVTGTKFTSPIPSKKVVLQPRVDRKIPQQNPAKKPSIAKTKNSTIKKPEKPK